MYLPCGRFSRYGCHGSELLEGSFVPPTYTHCDLAGDAIKPLYPILRPPNKTELYTLDTQADQRVHLYTDYQYKYNSYCLLQEL